MTTAYNFVVASDLLAGWQESICNGDPPAVYRPNDGPLSQLECVGPGMVTLIGGAPGAGKTALLMQYVVDTLIAMPGLKALVANVEMPATALLDRQLARISEISLSRIRRREFNSDEPMIISAIQTLTGVGDQLAFFEGKFSVDNVASAASSFGAQMVVLDYLQRFTADGEHTSQRDAVSAIMQQLRRWATAGAAVLVASAVSRTRDRQGNSYAGLGLASFRESSEIEFGADNCFIIEPTRNGPRNLIQLSHVKSRYTEPCNMVLMFDGQLQRFSEVMPGTDALPVGSTQTELQAQAAAAWEGSNGDQ